MKDASEIRARCDEVGDCLEVRSKARSRMRLHHPAGMVGGKYTLLRRALYEHETGSAIGDGVYLRPHCSNPKCIQPKHQARLSEQEKNIVGAKLGGNTPGRGARVAAARRARGLNKLTPEQVDEIKSSEESCDDLAARMGCDPSTISLIRRGVIWKDYTNPYLQLGAR